MDRFSSPYEAWRPWHEREANPKGESGLRASSSPPPDPQYWGIVVYTPEAQGLGGFLTAR